MTYKTPEQVSREYGEKSIERLEKDSRLNSMISGAVTIAVGIAVYVSTFSSSVSSARLVVQIISAIIILLGIYFLIRKKIEKIRRELLRNENSWLYKRKQSVMDKNQKKWRKRSGHHGSIKHEASIRARIISAVFTCVFFDLTLFYYIDDKVPMVFILMDIFCVVCFGLTFLGIKHKKLVRQFSEYGLDENAAEEDFKSSALYRKYASISSHFLTLFSSSSVIATEKIVWVFPKLCYVYHYMNGIYCGIQEKYSLMIYTEDGRYYVLECPEELCRILTDDICAIGRAVTPGFSQELFNLYSASPYNFRNAVRNFTMPSPYQMPPNEIK